MSRAIEIEGIERLEGRGITAKVTDTGKQYMTYQTFSDSIGYPDATAEYGKSEELATRVGEEFEVLSKGKHGSESVIIYVIESADGKQFLVGEDGLNISGESTSLETRENIEELIAEMRRQACAEDYEQAKKDVEICECGAHYKIIEEGDDKYGEV